MASRGNVFAPFGRALRDLLHALGRDWRRRKDPRFIVFLFQLPHALPVPDGSTYTFELDEPQPLGGEVIIAATPRDEPRPWGGSQIVSLRLWRVPSTIAALESFLEPLEAAIRKALPPEYHREPTQTADAETLQKEYEDEFEPYSTVVEAVTFLPRKLTERAISDAFDRCLDKAIDVFRAYRIHTRHPVPSLTFERLHPFVLYTTRAAAYPAKWTGDLSVLHLHFNFPDVPAPPFLDEAGLTTMGTALELVLRGHPFAAYPERRLDAEVAAVVDGEYGDAVIQTQVALEILFDGLLSTLLWEENHPPEAAASEIFEEGLAKRVRTHYGPRLGGNWNTKGRGVLGAWARDVADLRNRVVHAGYRASRAEARNAAATADRVESFVKERVVAKRNRYPRTALLLLGRPGLEEAGVWSGRIRAFADRIDEEPDWIDSYRRWRARLDDARP